MTTLQTVQQLLAGELSLPIETLDPSRPLDELGIDSLTLTECLFKLEDKFGISVATSEISVNNLQDIASMIDRQLAERQAPQMATHE